MQKSQIFILVCKNDFKDGKKSYIATKIVRLHWSTLLIIETTSLRVQRYHTYKYSTLILGYDSGQTVTNVISNSMVSNGEPSCNSILQAKIQGSKLSSLCASLHSRIRFFTLCRGRDEIARKPGRAGCSYSYRVVVFMAELPKKKKHSQTIHTSR